MKYNEAPKHWGMEDAHEGFRPDFWQGNNGECAINAQFRILQDYGYTGTVQDLKKEAIEHGWFTDDGTAKEDVGRLLELHGVPCEIYYDANRYNLLSELAQGKRIIVTVDSSELWRDDSMFSKAWEKIKDIIPAGADHALVVSGIDTSDPEHIQVVLTDSGDGHRTVSYPIEQFEDAWRDGMCQMVVTKTPPPEELAFDRIHDGGLIWDMSNFNYVAGHVNIGDESFEDWQKVHKEELAEAKVYDMDEAYFAAHKPLVQDEGENEQSECDNAFNSSSELASNSEDEESEEDGTSKEDDEDDSSDKHDEDDCSDGAMIDSSSDDTGTDLE